MKNTVIPSLLLLAASMPVVSWADEVIVSVRTGDATAISETLVTQAVSAEITNLGSTGIKNVMLRPDGSAHAFVTADVLQYGALAEGATRTLHTSLHRPAGEPGAAAPMTWRLDYDTASGQHHRLLIHSE